MRTYPALALSLSLALALRAIPSLAQYWYSAKVLDSSLAAGVSSQIQVASKLTCAAFAAQAAWPDLFCYDRGQCLLSDVKVSGYHDDSSLGVVSSCWTKHDCYANGGSYVEGDKFDFTCFPALCSNHTITLLETSAVPPCPPSFFEVKLLGCFLLVETPLSFDDARSFCITNHNADLAVPYNFCALNLALTSMGYNQDAWVGVQARAWLNGTSVGRHVWKDTAPNDPPEACGRIVIYNGNFVLEDQLCFYPFNFLCEYKSP